MAYFDNLCINFPQSSELMLSHLLVCYEEHDTLENSVPIIVVYHYCVNFSTCVYMH